MEKTEIEDDDSDIEIEPITGLGKPEFTRDNNPYY